MPDLNVGGQAVIEGVMMRSEDRVATAVRTPDGRILVKADPYVSWAKKHKLLKLPILRGAVSFVEMLVLGISTLNFSADIAIKEQEKLDAQEKGETTDGKPPKSNNLMLGLTVVFALAMGIFIFFFVPLAISNLFNVDKNAVWFNLLAGGIRLTMFVLYVWGISFFGEFRRIFQYHGAEHKSISTYEMGDELVPEQAARHTRFHPRCGTSFILIVALLAMFVYAVSDTIYALYTGHPPVLLTRFGLHFSLLPLVAGTSYELLKLSGKTRDHALTRILIQPGLWVQKITTREPTMDQLEVAIVALEASLGVTESKIASQKVAVP
ncbi:MAG: DUF1385 domain-containing protein [candidate division Zixibacteria bacterium]|nr:DUF1385 domain-containing protein [candidate division Zixibacteria bacterium]MDH3935883.1 DUF1385 domain-containing protein [candidate division Zixibacteria bacterium]MDH4034289.1 DUF1385 domain-containing protein [candidate division Zixibacteria bacterium]